MGVTRKAFTPQGVVDQFIVKKPVRLAVLTNIASLASVSTTFGGGTVVKGDRVGLFGQSTGSQNGIYVAGAVSGGNTALTRATDFDEDTEVGLEVVVAVQAGTLAGKRYRVSASGVVGTDTITFTEVPELTANATNGGSGNAAKTLVLDANGKAAGRVLETDGANLDAIYASLLTSLDDKTGAGALSVTKFMSRITPSGAADALTLADGSFVGQLKMVRGLAAFDGSHNSVLTPAHGNGFTTITWAANANQIGAWILLQWQAAGWTVAAHGGGASGAGPTVG